MLRRPALLALLVALLACAAPAAAQVPLPPLGGTPPPSDPPPSEPAQPSQPAEPEPADEPKRRKPVYAAVSNERTRTVWASPVARAKVRKRPRRGAHRVARLRYDTEDGFAEVYLVLARYRDAKGRRWLKVRVPMRPNGRRGWVRRAALGKTHRVRTFLRIDKRRLRATLYRSGHAVWHAPVGIGKRGTETPSGHFYVRERLRVRSRGSLYGPLAFGTSAYSKLSEWPGGGVIGIHGTNEPGLVPGRPSHGCIRMRNPDIVRLGRRMPIGTPILIK